MLTQMQFSLNKAISCLFSDTLIWISRYAGGNFDTHVIKIFICLIIFIDRCINQAACSIQQIFVDVSRDKSVVWPRGPQKAMKYGYAWN